MREQAAPGLERVEFEGRTLYLEPRAVFSDDDIVSAEPSLRQGELALQLELTPEAGERVSSISSAEIGSRLAVIVDSDVRSTHVIRGVLGGRAVIYLSMPQDEADRLAAKVRARWPEAP